MPILRFLWRKMWNTRWLTLSSLFGLTLAVAFTSSIPMYSDGSLKRVVAGTLAEKNQTFPAGAILLRYQTGGGASPEQQVFENVDRYIREELPRMLPFRQQTYVSMFQVRSAMVTLNGNQDVQAEDKKRKQMTLATIAGLAEHIQVVRGSMYRSSDKAIAADYELEALVVEETLLRNDWQIGEIVDYPLGIGKKTKPLKIKISGAFVPKNTESPFWYQGSEFLQSQILVEQKTFVNYVLETRKAPLQRSNWYYVFDLQDVKISQLKGVIERLTRMELTLFQILPETKVDISFVRLLEDFQSESNRLQLLLFTLAAPVLAMVFFFIVMNSRQALQKQRADIAVLRSRGASTFQIFGLYVLEGLMLGVVALSAGTLIGFWMAKVIGSANGFLEFVNRQTVPIFVSGMSLSYGLLAVLVAVFAGVVPAIQYAKSSIVGYKQQLARADQKPFWQRLYLDVILLLICGYGWYLFAQRRIVAQSVGLDADMIQANPLLFFVPALSIFVMGLFILRLFPLLLKILHWIGNRFMGITTYLTLTQLARSAHLYYPLMLLLILTLGLGVYNASAARTLDLNATERVLYEYGADVVVQAVWEADLARVQKAGGTSATGSRTSKSTSKGSTGQGTTGQGTAGQSGANPGNSISSSESLDVRTMFLEPPFEQFQSLPAVKKATRVLQTSGNMLVAGRSVGVSNVMGIDNVDFAEVGWFRADLFPAHPNLYLNFLGAYEQAAIIPQQLAEQYQLTPGDVFTVNLENQPVEFVMVAALPYWPSQYPEDKPFVIANLDYIYDQIPLIPYQVWLKLEDGAKIAPLVQALLSKKVEIAEFKDVRTELIKQKKLPSRGGVFGLLSLGFIVSILISLVGYILFWFFNLSNRAVQFGVLRAMGITRKQLTGILFLEQLLTTGLAICLGIVLGRLASLLFLPFLQTGAGAAQVPPFRIVFEARDSIQLYIMVGVMIVCGLFLLVWHIRRLKIHQAIKLGEEQ
jgi:putative ABC transport system permease protein